MGAERENGREISPTRAKHGVKKGPNRTQEGPKEAKNSLKGKNIVQFCLKKPDLSHLL